MCVDVEGTYTDIYTIYIIQDGVRDVSRERAKGGNGPGCYLSEGAKCLGAL